MESGPRPTASPTDKPIPWYACEGCTKHFRTQKALSAHVKFCKVWLDDLGHADAWENRGHVKARRTREAYLYEDSSDSDDDMPTAVWADEDSSDDDEVMAASKPCIDASQSPATISEQHRFINLFAEMRLKFAGNAMVDLVRTEIGELIQTIQARTQEAVTASAQANKILTVCDIIEPVQAALASVSSAHREGVVRESLIPCVNAVRRVLGTREETERLADGRNVTRQIEDVCYDMPFEQVLEQVMQNNKPVYDDILSSSARWTQQPAPDHQRVLRDLSD